MSRSVKEWTGATPDTPVPPRVKTRVFDRCKERCGQCGRRIIAETWTCEHLVALINGGENRESNLGVTCSWCLPAKNAADVAEKSDVYEKRVKHIGARPRSRHPVPGSKGTKFRKRMSGEVVLR